MAQAQALSHSTPAECALLPGCVCYSKPAQDRIAQWLIDDKECRTDLALKDDFIKGTMANIDAPAPAFWQTPSFVIGGVTVSAALASIATVLIVRKK